MTLIRPKGVRHSEYTIRPGKKSEVKAEIDKFSRNLYTARQEMWCLSCGGKIRKHSKVFFIKHHHALRACHKKCYFENGGRMKKQT